MDKTAQLTCNFAALPDWNDVRYAVMVARVGTIAEAARHLQMDQTTVSRRLRALESALGTPLFERCKGRLTPTPAGLAVLEHGQRIEAEIMALCHWASDRQTQVQGAIRITAVDALVSHYLAQHLADLHTRYPALSVELIASSRTLNLNRREADIAIRLARPADGDLVVRCLGRLAYGVYAATAFTTDAAWSSLPWVAYEHSLSDVPEMRWLAEHINPHKISLRCNNMDALATAVADGLGLAILPRFLGNRHQNLRCLSGATPLLQREMWLVIPRELRSIPRIQAVSDWLFERFQYDAAHFA